MSAVSHTDIARGFVAQLSSSTTKKATKQLAALIIEEKLHNQTDEILDSIQAEYQRVHGIVEATAHSVFPLSASSKKHIQAIVAEKTHAKQVVLHELINPELLGGVKITAPDMELDLTLKSKLAKLKA